MSRVVRFYEHTDEVVEISVNEVEEEVFDADEQAEDIESDVLHATRKQANEIINRAKEQAKKILDDAQVIAAAVQKQYLDEAQIRINELEDQALRDGYEQGFRRKSDELADSIQTIHREMKASLNYLKQQNSHIVKQQEEQLKFLALEIAARIMRKRCVEDPLAMDSMVEEALAMTKKSKRIHLEIPDNAKQLMQMLENDFREQPAFQGRNMNVETREMPSGTLYIESDMGLYDLSIDTQLENLKNLFMEFD